jgi:hypothetical protein
VSLGQCSEYTLGHWHRELMEILSIHPPALM